MKDQHQLANHVRDEISPTGRPKRLFVFVNPFGGKKCAKKIYGTEIKPLFEAAGVSITVQGSACNCGCFFSMKFYQVGVMFSMLLRLYIDPFCSWSVSETEYQGHALEVASSLDLAEYDGVVCVSGDGVLVEVSNTSPCLRSCLNFLSSVTCVHGWHGRPSMQALTFLTG